jgi:hypothetical protein
VGLPNVAVVFGDFIEPILIGIKMLSATCVPTSVDKLVAVL